jgi:hypothetical protein
MRILAWNIHITDNSCMVSSGFLHPLFFSIASTPRIFVMYSRIYSQAIAAGAFNLFMQYSKLLGSTEIMH